MRNKILKILYEIHILQAVNIDRTTSVRLLSAADLQSSSFIICGDAQSLLSNLSMTQLGVAHPSVVLVHSDQIQALTPTRIDQQVYFYNVDGRELFELYAINGVATKR